MTQSLTIEKVERFIDNFIENKKPPISLLRKYRKKTGISSSQIRLSNKSAEDKLNRCNLIFVADRPNFYFLRVSLALRKLGYKTCLITRWGVMKDERRFFNTVFIYNNFKELRLLKNIKKSKIYVQQWIGYNFLPVYVNLIVNRKIGCNINDYTSTIHKDKKDHRLFNFVKAELDFDFKCEKYILNNIDFVTSFYSDKAYHPFGKKIVKRVNKHLHFFPSYPITDFFYNKKRKLNSKNFNFLYVGMVAREGQISSERLEGTIEKYTNNKFHFSIFNNPQVTFADNKKSFKSKYRYMFQILKKNKYLNFQKGYFPWKLKNFTSKYHFASFPLFTGKVFSKYAFENHIHTKIFTNIEQCLPIVVSYKHKALYNYVKKHKLGITIDNKQQLKNFDKVIKSKIKNYSDLIQNIINYRKKYSMENRVKFIIQKMKIKRSHFNIGRSK